MKKRIFNRMSISTDTPVKIFHDGDIYEGKVSNISNNGLYIESESHIQLNSRLLMLHPFKSRMELRIPLQEKDLKVSVKVKRLKQNDDCQGIAVEVINPEIDYLEFVENFRMHLEHAHNLNLSQYKDIVPVIPSGRKRVSR